MSIYCEVFESHVRHPSQVIDSVEVIELICRRGDSLNAIPLSLAAPTICPTNALVAKVTIILFGSLNSL